MTKPKGHTSRLKLKARKDRLQKSQNKNASTGNSVDPDQVLVKGETVQDAEIPVLTVILPREQILTWLDIDSRLSTDFATIDRMVWRVQPTINCKDSVSGGFETRQAGGRRMLRKSAKRAAMAGFP